MDYVGYILDSNISINKELENIGVDDRAIDILNKKYKVILIKIKNVPSTAANILKQDMLSLGGDVAVNKDSVDLSVKSTDILVMGTRKQYNLLYDKIKRYKYFDVDKIGGIIKNLLDKCMVKEIKCGTKPLPI